MFYSIPIYSTAILIIIIIIIIIIKYIIYIQFSLSYLSSQRIAILG